ncbi:MAG: hypothetical protein KJO42_02150, partial [Silicimonas sp.]|nr:hypothetical protein [Silicimonas sp.]
EFSTIVSQHRNLESVAGPSPITDDTVAPPSSPASYEGFIVFDTAPRAGGSNPPGQVHYSRITVGVDFTTSTLSTTGGGDRFWYYDEVAGGPAATQVGGSVTVSSSAVRFDDASTTGGVIESFPLTISGNLDVNGGPNQTINSGASSMLGTFAGDADVGGNATNARFFAGDGTTSFSSSGSIPTRIITELQ